MNTSDILLIFVKIIILGQMSFIILFIMMMYLIKLVYYYKNKRSEKIQKKLQLFLNSYFNHKDTLSESSVVLLKKAFPEVLRTLNDIEKKEDQSKEYASLMSQLSEKVLKPKARKWVYSRVWHKRFDAVVAYRYGVGTEDEKELLKLLYGDSLLISINAVEIGVRHNLINLIDGMISKFSDSRYLEQSLVLDNLLSWGNNISSIALTRLDHDENRNTRIFCYRILYLYTQQKIHPSVKDDLKTDSNELKIAIIYYLIRCKDEEKNDLLYGLVKDPDSTVRATVATALSGIHTQESFEFLTELICDNAWWVSHNAAWSLEKHGPQGLEVLHKHLGGPNKLASNMAFSVIMKKAKLNWPK